MSAGDAPGVLLPHYLTQLPRWVLWRRDARINRKTGETMETKVPISCRTGKKCDITDPRTWADYTAVETALRGGTGAWDGPGLVLGLIEHLGEVLIALDLDQCLDEAGDPEPWTHSFLSAMPTYTEISASGTGLHPIARIRAVDLPAARRLLEIAEDDKDQARTRTFGPRANGSQHAPGAQLFLMKRYFAITGRHCPTSPEEVRLLTLEQIARLAAAFGPHEKRPSMPTTAPRSAADDDDAEPDEAALRDKLGAEFLRNPALRCRWEGGTDGLSDTTRSGRDMSVLAMLVTAGGFGKAEIRAALRQFEHGKMVDEDARYFERMWARTQATTRPERDPGYIAALEQQAREERERGAPRTQQPDHPNASPTGSWRLADQDEVFPPGCHFRLNVTTNQRWVFEPLGSEPPPDAPGPPDVLPPAQQHITEMDQPPCPVPDTVQSGSGADTQTDASPPDPALPDGVGLGDFRAYMPQHKYIFAPSRDLWPAVSVNARIPPVPLFDQAGDPVLDDDGKQVKIKASAWLDQHRAVETMTWAPGAPMIMTDRLSTESAIIAREGVTTFNLYRPPPALRGGNAKAAQRWLDHLHRIYPEQGEADHICRWFAQRLQRVAEKPNHALVLGGPQGIGKDTLIEPLKRALGVWNCAEVSPRSIVEAQFNGFARSILLRISEARDLGEVNRYAFYEAMKVYTAAPPDVLRVNEKNLRAYHILNCCGVVMTTNYKAGGIYLPRDDRRHFVAWSHCTKEDFSSEYWTGIWDWYENGGIADVAAYLAGLDLSAFNPKAAPPQTPAFWDIVAANCAPEDSELADQLDQLGNPAAVSLTRLIDSTRDIHGMVTGIGLWLGERKNRRQIPLRMEPCGYVPVHNPTAKDGLWKIDGKRQAVYAKATLLLRDQLAAAARLTL